MRRIVNPLIILAIAHGMDDDGECDVMCGVSNKQVSRIIENTV
jgi:hypothetical protein